MPTQKKCLTCKYYQPITTSHNIIFKCVRLDAYPSPSDVCTSYIPVVFRYIYSDDYIDIIQTNNGIKININGGAIIILVDENNAEVNKNTTVPPKLTKKSMLWIQNTIVAVTGDYDLAFDVITEVVSNASD